MPGWAKQEVIWRRLSAVGLSGGLLFFLRDVGSDVTVGTVGQGAEEVSRDQKLPFSQLKRKRGLCDCPYVHHPAFVWVRNLYLNWCAALPEHKLCHLQRLLDSGPLFLVV